jgi:predicted nucleotidyltransferase component of viral defense system
MGGAVHVITITHIRSMASSGGWKLDVCERVLRMGELLAAIAGHPELRDTLALKGGTAINTIDHNLPRLSVDLDFNYIGPATGEELEAARGDIDAAIHAVCSRLSLTSQTVRSAHGGSKQRMTYRGIVGSGRVEVDLNFLHRVPLLEPRRVDIRVTDAIDATGVLAISAPELAAGKLSALFDRTHPRDVWDTALLAGSNGGTGFDRLSGGRGRDLLIGGSGNDRIYADSGTDIVRAGSGNDRIWSRDGDLDFIFCGSGIDRVRADRRDILIGCERSW